VAAIIQSTLHDSGVAFLIGQSQLAPLDTLDNMLAGIFIAIVAFEKGDLTSTVAEFDGELFEWLTLDQLSKDAMVARCDDIRADEKIAKKKPLFSST
ncbi:hypothetical protein AeNC1_009221, partial [Aphanomyces euteiches]